jgi:hypothetical protein
MRKQVTVALGTFALAAGMLVALPGAAQAAAYPTSEFDITYGNTYTRGTLYWYNRSVQLVGEHKSVSLGACRLTSADTLTTSGHLATEWTGTVCNGSADFELTVPAEVIGGAAYVDICLESSTSRLDCDRIARP